MDLQEFKETYAEVISDLGLSEEQIIDNYEIYLEDPMQFTEGMIGVDVN